MIGKLIKLNLILREEGKMELTSPLMPQTSLSSWYLCLQISSARSPPHAAEEGECRGHGTVPQRTKGTFLLGLVPVSPSDCSRPGWAPSTRQRPWVTPWSGFTTPKTPGPCSAVTATRPEYQALTLSSSKDRPRKSSWPFSKRLLDS